MAVLWPQGSASIEDPFELVNPGEPLHLQANYWLDTIGKTMDRGTLQAQQKQTNVRCKCGCSVYLAPRSWSNSYEAKKKEKDKEKE